MKEFIHLKTGNHYVMVMPILSKHPETGKWYDAVLYRSLETNKEFVRSKKSFDSHFKEV